MMPMKDSERVTRLLKWSSWLLRAIATLRMIPRCSGEASCILSIRGSVLRLKFYIFRWITKLKIGRLRLTFRGLGIVHPDVL